MRAAKVDGNHAEITNGLRKQGWSVKSLAKIGDGMPDLLVGVNGVNVLLEIKMPGEKLNKVQTKWHEEWRGVVWTVWSLDEAIKVCLEVAARPYAVWRSGR